jgi:hypothetical protein
MRTLAAAVTAFLDFVDERAVVRRIAFFWMIWITTQTVLWSIDFAATSPRPGGEVAAIIAAILGFISALQAVMIGFYSTARTQQQSAPAASPLGTGV